MERAGASSSSMGSSRRSAAVAATSAALAASSGAVGVDTRKRKRGALQDISNTSQKIAEATARGIVKKERGSSARASTRASSKPPTAAPAPVPAQTARVPLRAAGSRINSARGGGNVVIKKEKTDALPKKRKHEAGAENLQPPAPHQKVQSLLTFQATSRSTRARSSAAVATRSSDAGAQTELSMNQELRLVKSENKENEVPEDEPMLELKQETATFSWSPRPYKFTFNHTNSGFDARTYAAAVRDIDALPNVQNAAHCVKLVREIDTYHRLHEDKYFPEPDYIGSLQTDINEKMRTILIDWLVEVGEEYELDSQTFHKAVNLVDRCLKKFKINRKQFQLLGCACMMVAAKFEEVYGPNVEEFVYISDQTYTAEEMLEMEAKVLQALEYRVASTTCYGFVTRYTQAGCTSEKQKSLVMYLCDYAQLYYRMLKFRPSVVVASAVYLARLMTGEREAWTPTLHHVTKYNPWELRACVLELLRLHRIEADVVASQRDKAKAVSEKYLADKFHAASAIPPVEEAAADRSFLEYERPAATS